MSLMRFVEERNEALVSLDREKIEKYADKYGIELPDDDEVFWRSVHKAIANISTLSDDVRQRSVEWLRRDSEPEIRPCPICGAKLKKKTLRKGVVLDHPNNGCEFAWFRCRYDKESIDIWNRRVGENDGIYQNNT